MSDEEHGEDNDHSRTGQQPETGTSENIVHADGFAAPESEATGDAGEAADVGYGSGVGGKELERALNTIRSASEDDLRNAGLIGTPMTVHQQMMQTALMSGPLPPADEFNRYSPEYQERMCRWNDAFTIDESRRQDMLVKEEIDQARTGRWLTTSLLVFFGAVSAGLFAYTGDSHSFWLLSVPVVSIVGNMIQPIFSKSSRGRREKNNEDAKN